MCVLSWLVFLIGHQYLIGVWHGEDQITNTLTTTCLSSNFITYSTLNSEHGWEDLQYPPQHKSPLQMDNFVDRGSLVKNFNTRWLYSSGISTWGTCAASLMISNSELSPMYLSIEGKSISNCGVTSL